MSIDVILPFHRIDKFLMEAIYSVLQSEHISLRIILINDSSESLTLEDLELHSIQKHRIILTPPGFNSGYGKSLDRAKTYIEADFVGLMNSDDLIHPEKYARQVQQLKASSSDISITKIKRVTKRGNSSSSIFAISEPFEYSPFFLLLGSYGANASWTLNSNLFLKLDFDSDACLDWRIAMSIFPHLRISYIPEPLYSYRRHSLQVTKDQLGEHQIEIVYSEWKKLAQTLGIGLSSRDQFISLATPWAGVKKLDPEEVFSGICLIREKAIDLPKSSQRAVNEILKRRMVFSLLATRGLTLSSFRCSLLGLSDVARLINDFRKR